MKEIAKLLATSFNKEVFHPEWLANPVLVKKKKNNEWRMYVDYTDLNKNCPKDPFWLPCINQVIDSIAGCILLCFLDCYSGYHQIALKEEDQIKTAFITSYCVRLYDHVLRVEERRRNVPVGDPALLRRTATPQCGGLCG
jgi:hypothetical protein